MERGQEGMFQDGGVWGGWKFRPGKDMGTAEESPGEDLVAS